MKGYMGGGEENRLTSLSHTCTFTAVHALSLYVFYHTHPLALLTELFVYDQRKLKNKPHKKI